MDYIGDWNAADLVDPRGHVEEERVDTSTAKPAGLDPWPIEWRHRRVGLMSNKKPNADALLDAVKELLIETAPDLSFVYGSKEPLAENAPAAVIDSLAGCDVVVLASAECGGCTSWVCRDYLTLEGRGVPCIVIATNRFEGLARAVLARGGVTEPHLIVPAHPVSGITADAARDKIRQLAPHVRTEILGHDAVAAAEAA